MYPLLIVKGDITYRVPTAQEKQGKQGKWPNKIPVREKTRNLEILSKHRENTGTFVGSSCKCSDSKSKGYCDSCSKNIQKLDRSAKSVLCM